LPEGEEELSGGERSFIAENLPRPSVRGGRSSHRNDQGRGEDINNESK